MKGLTDHLRHTRDEMLPDVLIAGTPCQSFSVAGPRTGLNDKRGKLALTYVEIADAVDANRKFWKREPSIIVWENVPGVLTSKDNAFGEFLGALSGACVALQPPSKKWKNAGYVSGPTRRIAWRVLAAQYFGVPQRRRRVYTIASARDGFDPAEVLFERKSGQGDLAPGKNKEKKVAALTASGVGTGGADDNQAQAGHLICSSNGPGSFGSSPGTLRARAQEGHEHLVVAKTLTAPKHGYRGDYETENYVVHGTQDPCVSTGRTFTLGRNNGGENIIFPAVRRLMPIECERLQGFPDNYTPIPWRGNPAEQCPDGHRYKAIGNSMAVPVIRWLGERIQKEMER